MTASAEPLFAAEAADRHRSAERAAAPGCKREAAVAAAAAERLREDAVGLEARADLRLEVVRARHDVVVARHVDRSGVPGRRPETADGNADADVAANPAAGGDAAVAAAAADRLRHDAVRIRALRGKRRHARGRKKLEARAVAVDRHALPLPADPPKPARLPLIPTVPPIDPATEKPPLPPPPPIDWARMPFELPPSVWIVP